MGNMKQMTMISPLRVSLLVSLLMLITSQFASAADDLRAVYAESVRGAALRRSVLDIHSYDFFSSRDGGKGMKHKSHKAKKSKKSKGSKKNSLKLGGKGRKGKGRKGKGKGKGKGESVPTTAPSFPPGSPTQVPASTSSSPNLAPVPTPTSPTQAPTPAPTSSPTILDGINVVTISLTQFSVSYQLEELRIPMTTEAVAVGVITATYLRTYFEEIYFRDPNTILEDFVTFRILDGDSFGFDGVYDIQYNSMAVFSTQSSTIPTLAELDDLLSQAFLGENQAIYVGLIQSLPIDNIFSSTSVVSEIKTPPPSVPGGRPGSRAKGETRRESSSVPIGAAVAAGTFVLVILGVVVYRRRERYDELDKLDDDAMGHMTVAGETFLGNSTAYSASESGTDMLSETNELEESHSKVSQSEWIRSTDEAISEQGSEESSLMSDEGSVRSSLSDSIPVPTRDPLESTDASVDDGNESEDDEDVPMRVVDLIKRFSLSYSIPKHTKVATS